MLPQIATITAKFNGVGTIRAISAAMISMTKAPLGRSNVRLGAPIALAAITLATIASPLAAHDSSAWDGAGRSAVRLIAGAASDEASVKIYRAGIDIRLDPGW